VEQTNKQIKMKKWLVGYWVYKNDQWEDYEIIIEAQNFDEAYTIFKDKKRLGKLRYIEEYFEKKIIKNQQHTDMKIALETALNFDIPDQLRKIIENTLKSLK
jgi:hypothetical protein